MFALEIDFHDGVSPSEVLLVRRAHAVIGAGEYAHVVIEGGASSVAEVRLTRGLGREFRCQPLKRPGAVSSPASFLEGEYPGEAELDLGDVTTFITALDVDLQPFSELPPDRAAIKTLRRALTSPSPKLPAVALHGQMPVYVSFNPAQGLLVGRSRKCALRLDASDVSSEHARIDFEDGKFYVEDLSSTNGTFLVTSKGNEKVNGRVEVPPGDKISVGEGFNLSCVSSIEDINKLNLSLSSDIISPEERVYPCVMSSSEFVRPSQLVLTPGGKVSIGRDPANDIWVGAPHISRHHSDIMLDHNGAVRIVDHSSNGTFLNGERLESEVPVRLLPGNAAIDLSSGISIVVCFSKDDESALNSKGSGELFEPKIPLSSLSKVTDHNTPHSLASISEDQLTGSFPAQEGYRKGEKFEEGVAVSHMQVESSSPVTSAPGAFSRLASREGNRIGDSREAPEQAVMTPQFAIKGGRKSKGKFAESVDELEDFSDEQAAGARGLGRWMFLFSIIALLGGFILVALWVLGGTLFG